MATKLTLTAALLLAMVAFATATTYTTVVTTVVDDDEANPQPQQQCQRQIQGRQFRSCQRYLSGGRRNSFDDEVIEMTTENTGDQSQYNLRKCCEQLRNINEQCRCEAIRHAVRQQQQGQQHGSSSHQGQQMEVQQRAQNLPRQCNFRQPQQCQIRTIFV